MVAQARSTSQNRPLNTSSTVNASTGKISPPAATFQLTPNGVSSRNTSAGRSQNAGSVISGGSRQNSRAPPPVEDEESWPEVGKAVAQPPARTPQPTINKHGEEKEEQEEKNETSQSSGSQKKSE